MVKSADQARELPDILCADEALVHHYLSLGARFVAVGVDTALLIRSCTSHVGHFSTAFAPTPAMAGVY